MKKLFLFAVGAALAVFAVLLGLKVLSGSADALQVVAPEKIAYVASADQRIYVVDIAAGKLVSRSDPIDGVGRPTSLEIDQTGSILYIGSERGPNQNDYYPLVAVSAKDDFAVVRQYTIHPDRQVIDKAVLNPDVHAVYRVTKSKDGDRLFLLYSAPGSGLTTEFDLESAAIVREIDVPITANSIFSSDGTLVADIYPSGSRTDDGVTTQWPGAVLVREFATGAVISDVKLSDDKGLQSPWADLASPFVYLARRKNSLNVYDRDSGKVLSSLDLSVVTGLLPTGADPKLLDGGPYIVLTMMNSTEGVEPRGYVVVVDYMTGEVVFTVEVGPQPTNIVWHAASGSLG